MSYADVTKKNAHQSAEEARANPVPELVPTESASTVSLIDVDSPHISSVPSTYAAQEIKTTTQADRLEREAEAEQLEVEAKARAEARAVKARGPHAGRGLLDNADNPVVLGNAILGACVVGVLGHAGYGKYRAGQFTWQVAGIGAAAVAAFGVLDFYATQYFLDKYPSKK